MREDLPELIAEAKKAGCKYVQLNSNGIRIANEKGYIKKLKEAGLSFVFMQFDGVTDDVYKTLRGKNLFLTKCRAIANCAKENIGVTLVPTVVPGVNDKQLGDILRFAVKHSPAVRGVHLQPAGYLGRIPDMPEEDARYPIDRLLYDLVEQSEGLIYFPGTNPDGVSDILRRAVNDIGVEAVMVNGIYDIEKAAKEGEGAQCYCGMPIQLYRLCKKAPHLKPKSLLLSADYIPQVVVENFKKIWGCDVYPHYGMTEMGLGFAVDCPHHNGMHMRNADIYLEIINPDTGEILPDGETGELVFTTIRREAMPLIRYRTGDIGRMVKNDKVCGCGNTMPMLEVVYGRGRDNVLTDGTNGFGVHIMEEILLQKVWIWLYAQEV